MSQLGLIDGLMAIVSVILILLVALQQTKQGLSDSLSGGNSELFKQQKERGFEVVLTRLTYGFSCLFLILGIFLFMK